jgi:hypothetical protein
VLLVVFVPVGVESVLAGAVQAGRAGALVDVDLAQRPRGALETRAHEARRRVVTEGGGQQRLVLVRLRVERGVAQLEARAAVLAGGALALADVALAVLPYTSTESTTAHLHQKCGAVASKRTICNRHGWNK